MPKLAHQLVAYPMRSPARVMLGSMLLQTEKILSHIPVLDTFHAMTPAEQPVVTIGAW